MSKMVLVNVSLPCLQPRIAAGATTCTRQSSWHIFNADDLSIRFSDRKWNLVKCRHHIPLDAVYTLDKSADKSRMRQFYHQAHIKSSF